MKMPDATAIEIPIALKDAGRPPPSSPLLSSARARSEMLSLRSMAVFMVPIDQQRGFIRSRGRGQGTMAWSIVYGYRYHGQIVKDRQQRDAVKSGGSRICKTTKIEKTESETNKKNERRKKKGEKKNAEQKKKQNRESGTVERSSRR